MNQIVPYDPKRIAVIDVRIRATCHPKQAEFVFDPGRRVSLLVGRGGGKTSAEIMRMIRKMASRPRANCLYVAGSRDSAKRLAWSDAKRFDSQLGLQAKFNESSLIMSLPNGSQLILFGCDDSADIQKLRGLTWHEVALDEVASIKLELLKELMDEVIGPRMVGTLALIGTPGKRLDGEFYEATRRGGDRNRSWEDRHLPEYAGWDNWSCHRWNITDGVAAGIEAMIEIYAEQQKTKIRQGYSDDNPYWLREYMGEWALKDSSRVYLYQPHNDDGTEHNQWTPVPSRNGFAAPPADLKDIGYAVGMDLGFKDAFAIEIFAFSYSDPRRTLWHVHEVYRARLGPRDVAKILIGEALDHGKPGGIFGVIGWPDIMVGDFAMSGEWFLKELREVYSIVVTAADKPYKYKENAIEAFNSDLFDGRIKVMRDSKLAAELGTLQWVVDQGGKRQEDQTQANHATDAALYMRNAVAPLLASATIAPAPTPDTRAPYPDDDDRVPMRAPEEPDADNMYEW